MNSTVLVTSIPPVKVGDQEAVVSHRRNQWQLQCVQSWLESHDRVLSVNIPSEARSIDKTFVGVDVVEADRSTEPINGRPLPFLIDLIRAGLRTGAKRIAIANADIRIDCLKISGNVLGLTDDMSTYAYRMDVDPATGSRTPFYGIDYFNLSRTEALKLPEALFAIGLPWWDYWLPTLHYNNGKTVLRLESKDNGPALTHLKHAEAWSPTDFLAMGIHYFSQTFIDSALQSSDVKVEDDLESVYSKLFTVATSLQNQNRLHHLAALARTTSEMIHRLAHPVVIG